LKVVIRRHSYAMLVQRETLKASYFTDREPVAVPVSLYADEQKLRESVAARPRLSTTTGPRLGCIRVRLSLAELQALRSVPVRVETAEADCLSWLCCCCLRRERMRVVITCSDGKTFLVADDSDYTAPVPDMNADAALKWIAHLASGFNRPTRTANGKWIVVVTAPVANVRDVETLFALFLRAMKHQLSQVHAIAIHSGYEPPADLPVIAEELKEDEKPPAYSESRI